jgi:eukaryotic-like serine/threonine-protein kinase
MGSDPSPNVPRRAVRIGKYQVISHIATGGMGAVYKARDVELRRDVALKILSPEMAAKPGLLERFRREARHAARLRHENIVAIYEYGETGDTHFLALEYVDGVDLREYIERKGKLDPEEARIITLQATRALVHAHAQGIIHRDIKPSNFLVARPEGGILVKLTDLGLAREAGDEDFRVTRAGTTVGTIDYIAPEQARDSALADIRSDLYSLGCTLYHMLAGQAPFAEGGLTERLYKHIEAEPPDVLQFNPGVPPGLSYILYKLLAKKPEERYQTPAELLHDLLHVDELKVKKPVSSRGDVLAGLAEIESPKRSAKNKTQSDLRPKTGRPRPVNRPRPDDETRERLAAATRTFTTPKRFRSWLIGLAAILPIVCLAAGVGVALRAAHRSKGVVVTEKQSPNADDSLVGGSADSEPGTTKGHEGSTQRIVGATPKQMRWPALYQPAVPFDAGKLKEEYEGSWPASEPPPPDTPLFRVSRAPRGNDGPHFDSLAVACAAAPADRLTIIEIDDNGPFFAAAVSVKNRSLIIRSGPGFRPLLIWDYMANEREIPPSPRAEAFISVSQGNLTLENLELAVRRDGPAQAASFARMLGGDLAARGCTFSVAGKQRGSVSIARLDSFTSGTPTRCRFSGCFGRGPHLGVVDLQASGAQVLLDNCLFVGGDEPLIRVRGYQQLVPTTIRVCHATLIARQTLMHVQPAGDIDIKPAVRWYGWDSILARPADQSGGTLLALEGKTETGNLQWHAANCCYSGWKTLLTGLETIQAKDIAAWRVLWRHDDAESAVVEGWPAAGAFDSAESLPDAFRPAPYPDSPVGYAATTGGALGCDLAGLPPCHDNWGALTHERFVLPSLDWLRGPVPTSLFSPDDRYCGEQLDLNRVDLGDYLRSVQESRKLAPLVVMHLQGSGERKSSPIRWKGANLVLCVDAPNREGAPPLILVPKISDPTAHPGWIDVEDGNLDVIGMEVRCSESKLALLPTYLFHVRGGNIRLQGCRLYGPRTQTPDAFRGLIGVDGGGRISSDRATNCTVDESVLVSGKNGIQVNGTGAHLALRQCVIATVGDALFFEPGSARARLNLYCELEHSTFAAMSHVLRIGPVTGREVPLEPLVVQSQGCAFLAPFAGERAGLLQCDGESLARGVTVWQGEGNVFDKRMHSFVTLGDDAAERTQAFAVWAKVWGPDNEIQPLLNVPLTNVLKWEPLQLDHLLLPEIKPPSGSSARIRPGADLGALGLLPKPAKPK